MPDSPSDRRSNWADAAAVELPSCPHCGCANIPGASPMIEQAGAGFACAQCGMQFLVPPAAA